MKGKIDSSAEIHSTAIVEKGATIGANVKIGPFCIVGSQVEIGSGTHLKSHVIVNGITKIGQNNTLYQFVTVGEVNQDLKYAGEPTQVEIGDRNTLHEGTTIHRGTTQGGGLTKIGGDNLFMVYSHVAHDCLVGNRCVFANNATLGGHVIVGDFAIIGGLSAVHQNCIVGKHTMIGGCSAVVQDVLPYVIAQGNHAVPYGVNIEGLKRRGFSKERINAIRSAYRLVYRSGKKIEEVKTELEIMSKEQSDITAFVELLSQSKRGLIR